MHTVTPSSLCLLMITHTQSFTMIRSFFKSISDQVEVVNKSNRAGEQWHFSFFFKKVGKREREKTRFAYHNLSCWPDSGLPSRLTPKSFVPILSKNVHCWLLMEHCQKSEREEWQILAKLARPKCISKVIISFFFVSTLLPFQLDLRVRCSQKTATSWLGLTWPSPKAFEYKEEERRTTRIKKHMCTFMVCNQLCFEHATKFIISHEMRETLSNDISRSRRREWVHFEDGQVHSISQLSAQLSCQQEKEEMQFHKLASAEPRRGAHWRSSLTCFTRRTEIEIRENRTSSPLNLSSLPISLEYESSFSSSLRFS